MSLLHSSSIGDVMRGGQLLIHFFRMLGQVLSKFASVLLLILLATSVALFFNRTAPYHRYVALQYAVAQVKYQTFRDASEPTVVRRRDGSEIQTSVGEVVNSPSIRRIWRSVVVTGIGCFVAALALPRGPVCGHPVVHLADRIRAASGSTAARWRDPFCRRSEALAASRRGGQRHHRGRRTAHRRHPETGHILVAGTTGSGKTQALLELLRAVRARGDRVVCFSPSGDFISAFYREGRYSS